MPAFAVISTVLNDDLDRGVANAYPDAFLKLSNTSWIVSDTNKTTKEVCDKIGIKAEGFSNAVVFKTDGYFGLAAPTIWEWLKVKGAGP